MHHENWFSIHFWEKQFTFVAHTFPPCDCSNEFLYAGLCLRDMGEAALNVLISTVSRISLAWNKIYSHVTAQLQVFILLVVQRGGDDAPRFEFWRLSVGDRILHIQNSEHPVQFTT